MFLRIFDPYVAANTLEAIYELAGNSQRRVDFVKLTCENVQFRTLQSLAVN